MVKSPKVATPDTAATVNVPPSVAGPSNPLASCPIAITTSPVNPVAVFPKASNAVTTTGGEISLPTTTWLGWTVNTSCAASAGFTITLGLSARGTPPAVAVIVFVPMLVELNVPVMTPSPPVVPDGVRLLPAPAVASVTGTPLTAFPKASLTVTVIVETLSPLLAVIGLGDAVTEDRLELGEPGVPVAVNNTGSPVMPLGDALAVSVFGPGVAARTQDVTVAMPSPRSRSPWLDLRYHCSNRS